MPNPAEIKSTKNCPHTPQGACSFCYSYERKRAEEAEKEYATQDHEMICLKVAYNKLEAKLSSLQALLDKAEIAIKSFRSHATKEVNSGAATWYVDEMAKLRYNFDTILTEISTFRKGKP